MQHSMLLFWGDNFLFFFKSAQNTLKRPSYHSLACDDVLECKIST